MRPKEEWGKRGGAWHSSWIAHMISTILLVKITGGFFFPLNQLSFLPMMKVEAELKQ